MESSASLNPDVLLFLERCKGPSNVTVDVPLFRLLGIDVEKTTPVKAYTKAKKRLREVGGDVIQRNATDLKLTVSPTQMLQTCLRFGFPEFRDELSRYLCNAIGKEAAYARRAAPVASPGALDVIPEALATTEAMEALGVAQSPFSPTPSRPATGSVVGLQKTLDLDPRLRSLFPY